MIPLKALQPIYVPLTTIHEMLKKVKANKHQCQRLHERIESIHSVLKQVSIETLKQAQMERAVQQLEKTVQQCSDLVQKFTASSNLSFYWNNTSHQKEFERLNVQLSQNAVDLNLAINIASVFDRRQDEADREADLTEISTKLDEIAKAMAEQRQLLVEQNAKMQDEFKRQFDSFKFHLQQDILIAKNPTQLKKIEEETRLFLHIPGHDLRLEERIGQGGFADVYRGTWLSRDHHVAIKVIRVSQITDTVKQDFLNEISTMHKIRYDHVLGVFGACIESNFHALVIEYMSLGSLFSVLHSKQHNLSWHDRWLIASQMAKGVNFLHKLSIIHRDIKSLNFLIDRTINGYLVKISDFGLAKIRQETMSQSMMTNTQHQSMGTLQWKAPELLKFGKPSTASDVYSLGIVFWELATRCIPYDESNESTIYHGVCAGNRLEIPTDVPIDFVRIITNSWNQDPSKRPTSEDLMQEITKIMKANTLL